MINLIFDLDQTLIDSTALNNYETVLFKTDKRHNEIFGINTGGRQGHGNYIITCRAYSSVILRYCFKNFNVGFWTAGRIKYGDDILKRILLPEEYKKCVCIIGRTSKTADYWKCKDIINKTNFKIPKLDGSLTKPLSLLFEDNKNYKGIHENNTLLIDNSPWNIIPNPKNSIYIVDSCTKKTDDLLFLLYLKLKEIRRIKDVTKIDFREYFKNSYDVVSCKNIYKVGLVKKKKIYEIGDCIEGHAPGIFYIILGVNTGRNTRKKSVKKSVKKKSIVNPPIKYKVVNYFFGEDEKHLDHADIVHQVII
jgi:hypothetical protein